MTDDLSVDDRGGIPFDEIEFSDKWSDFQKEAIVEMFDKGVVTYTETSRHGDTVVHVETEPGEPEGSVTVGLDGTITSAEIDVPASDSETPLGGTDTSDLDDVSDVVDELLDDEWIDFDELGVGSDDKSEKAVEVDFSGADLSPEDISVGDDGHVSVADADESLEIRGSRVARSYGISPKELMDSWVARLGQLSDFDRDPASYKAWAYPVDDVPAYRPTTDTMASASETSATEKFTLDVDDETALSLCTRLAIRGSDAHVDPGTDGVGIVVGTPQLQYLDPWARARHNVSLQGLFEHVAVVSFPSIEIGFEIEADGPTRPASIPPSYYDDPSVLYGKNVERDVVTAYDEAHSEYGVRPDVLVVGADAWEAYCGHMEDKTRGAAMAALPPYESVVVVPGTTIEAVVDPQEMLYHYATEE